jgi:hypothetical protein
MALTYQHVAGGYRATWNGNSIGQVEEGFTLEYQFEGETIKGHNLGQSVQDIVYQGGNVFLSGVLTEYGLAGLRALAWPWAATFGKVGVVGTLAGRGSIAKQLVLTKVTGTNAYYSTITATLTILAPGFPISLLLAPKHKKVPFRLQILPDGSLDDEGWFTAVAA